MCCSFAKSAAFLAALVAVAGGAYLLEQRQVVEAATPMAPRFEVDPFWPKPLPNHWVIGATIGVAVDNKDNVWIIHRGNSLEEKERYATWNPKAAECCAPAPPVLAFSPAGDLIASWGGNNDGFEWPTSNHGIDVDHKGNVWIGGNGRGKVPAALAHDESKMAAAGAVHDSMLLKFTQSGKFLMQIGKPWESKGSNDIASWGGNNDGFEWPTSNHGIDVDHKGNIWIGGNGRGKVPAALAHDESKMAAAGAVHDSMLLKFTQSGKFLMQIGKPWESKGSNDIANLRLPAKSIVDPKTNELYVADGYGNRRVIVFDADTGKYKRHWGAYGNKPDDTDLGPFDPNAPAPKQFRTPVHGVILSNDGLLYVCDRTNNRIQVFKTDGTYVKETWVAKPTLGDGATFDVALSRDPKQQYLYVADGSNMKVHILLRETLEEIATFGDGGRQPGQFYAVHSIATDSKGNIYTTETYRGQRVQKFNFRGLAPIAKKDQGAPWPKR